VSVQVNQLTKLYGKQKAVDQVSFTAKEGEILGFLGPNGAGKSTTMKMLTCFIPPTLGSANICGFDILAQPMEVRRVVGYLPEHNPLYLDLYVQESLYFMADIHQISNKKQRIADVIAQVGLGDERHKKIADLSKGYRQRVGLAQAILHNPQVLILDEPTSGLDPNQIISIRQLIKTLGKTKTIILSTHILQEVDAICNQVVIINKGHIVANSTIQELKHAHHGKSLEDIFTMTTNG
jgi:ABC-2 type transport system ATP-binding protein